MATVLIALPSIVTLLLAVLVVGLVILSILIHIHDNLPTYGVKLTAKQKATLRAIHHARRDVVRINHEMDKLNKSGARYDSLLYPIVEEQLRALQHSRDVLTDYISNVQLT